MKRYIVRHRRAMFLDQSADPDFERSGPCGLTVDETGARWTGLLDANGDPIFRAPEPFGFQ